MSTNPLRLPLLIAMALLVQPAALAQDVPVGGLDVFLLVDVSRSMYRNANGGPGSDPERIRWDGVRLILNLLTAEDRAVVVPFNEFAPAQTSGQPVAGPHDLRLLPPEDGDGPRLRVIDSLTQPGDTPLLITDSGKTSIFKALAKAGELARLDGRRPGRRKVALVLTDGGDDRIYSDHPETILPLIDDPDRSRFRSLLEPWAPQGAGRTSTPVHTLGLGPEAQGDLLSRIASETGGSYTKVGDNASLLAACRDLIWNLKGSWIKEVDMADSRMADDLLRGIVDLGVFSFAESVKRMPIGSRPDPRNTSPPASPPSMAWSSDPADRVPNEVRKAGKDGGGYLFEYFGPPSWRDPGPFARAIFRLSTTWEPPQAPQRLLFAKRTARPLLEVVEPREARSFERYEELPVLVRLEESPDFGPDDFDLKLDLRPTNGSATTGLDGSVGLEPVAGSRDYRAKVRLDRLSRSKGKLDYYAMKVVARGRKGRPNALADYRLELPRRTIEVRNSLALEPVEAVELTTKQPRRTVELKSRATLKGDTLLRVRFDPGGETLGKRIGRESIAIRQVTSPDRPPPGGDAVRLEDGRAVVELTIDPAHPPEKGVAYAPARLEFTGKELEMTPLIVLVGLRLDLARLSISPPNLRLEAGERVQGGRSGPIRVEEASPTGLSLRDGPTRVELRKLEGFEFGPEELHLEPPDSPGGTASAPARSLSSPLGRPFGVTFQPKADSSRLGRHDYALRVTMPGAEPIEARVTLDYKPPRIELPAPSLVVRASPGSSALAEVAATLLGLEGDSRSIYYVPDLEAKGRPNLVVESPPGGTTGVVDVAYPGPSRAEPVRAGGDPATLRLTFSTPPDLPFGRYRLDGKVVGARVVEAPVAIQLVVNGLEVLASGKPGDAWRPVVGDRIRRGHFVRREYSQTIRLRTALGDPLDPASIRITPGDAFANDDGDRLARRLQLEPTRDIRALPGGTEVEVTLRFPGVPNADPGRPYHLPFDIEGPSELKLAARRIDLVVTFFSLEDQPSTGAPPSR